MSNLFIPSYAQGFARNAAESENPGLWTGVHGHWLAPLGPTGSRIPDWSGRHNDCTLVNITPANAWMVGPKGWSVDLPALANPNVLQLKDKIVFTAPEPWSFTVWFNCDQLYNTPGLWGHLDTTGAKSKLSTNSNGECRLYNDAGSTIWFTGGAWDYFPIDPGLHCYTLSCRGTSFDFYRDGIKVTQNTTTVSGTFSIYRLLNNGGGSTYDCEDGQFISATVHDRALAPYEAQQLHADPYAMVRPRRRVFAAATGNDQTASLSVVSATVAQPAVTPTYQSELSASVAAVVATVTQPAVTASSTNDQTASLAVVSAAVAQPEVTPTYQSELSAGVAVVSASVAQPAVTPTYQSELSATLAAVVASVTQPAVTASSTNDQTASLAVVAASVAQPEVTPTYQSELSAGVAVVSAQVAQPTVTPTYQSELSATLAAVVASVTQPAVTAAAGNDQVATLAVVSASVTQPAVTPTYQSELSATLDAVVAQVAQPAVGPSWILAATASLDAVVATVTQPTVTATTGSGGCPIVLLQSHYQLSL